MVVGRCVAERAMRQGHADVRYDEQGDCHRKRIKTDAQNAAASGGAGFSGVASFGFACALPAPTKGAAGPRNRKGWEVSPASPITLHGHRRPRLYRERNLARRRAVSVQPASSCP